MDAWRHEADKALSQRYPERYAAPRMPEPPEPPPADDRRQLPRSVSWNRYPDEDVIWVDGWIRSLRWLVAYRALDVDDHRIALGTGRRERLGPARRPSTR